MLAPICVMPMYHRLGLGVGWDLQSADKLEKASGQALTASLSTMVSLSYVTASVCAALYAISLFSSVCSASAPAGDNAIAGSFPPAISPSKIALLHMVNNVWFFQELAGVTKRNKARYAARHGYEMIVHDPAETRGLFAPADCDAPGAISRGEGKHKACYVPDNSFTLDKRAPTFGKIKLAIAACVSRDDYWLLWTDADALIFNQARSLLDIVDDSYDIMVSSDWLMINAGVMLMRCSTWNMGFLNKVYAAREFDTARALDQSALDSFMKEEDAIPHVKHVPKWLINGESLALT